MNFPQWRSRVQLSSHTVQMKIINLNASASLDIRLQNGMINIPGWQLSYAMCQLALISTEWFSFSISQMYVSYSPVWNFPCQPWATETEHVTQGNAGMLHNALPVCQECFSCMGRTGKSDQLENKAPFGATANFNCTSYSQARLLYTWQCLWSLKSFFKSTCIQLSWLWLLHQGLRAGYSQSMAFISILGGPMQKWTS